MRIRVVIACLACGAAAAAGPLRHKPSTPDYPLAALRLFATAAVMERAGRLDEAEASYLDSARSSPQAITSYDLAIVELAREDFRAARVALAKYLELAPKATDRAEVEQVMLGLEHRQPALFVGSRSFDTSELGSVVMLDGVPVGTSPVTLHPTAGSHLVESIGPQRYARAHVVTTAGRDDSSVDLDGKLVAGNVLIDGDSFIWSDGTTWTEGTTSFAIGVPFTLPVGHYETSITAAHPTCAPVTFAVTSATALTHVHLLIDPAASTYKCISVSKVIVNQPLRRRP